MKFLIVVLVAAFSSLTVKAQENNIFKKKPWEEYKLKQLLEDTLSRIKPLIKSVPSRGNVPYENEKGVVRVPLKGLYIGENGKGDEIYAMQPDNMPCLVPGKKFISNMPVAGFDKTDKSLLPLLQKDEEKLHR